MTIRSNGLRVILALTTALLLVAVAAATLPVSSVGAQDSGTDEQLFALRGWETDALFTVGDTIVNPDGSEYTPAGILDGTSARPLANGNVEVLVNHELGNDVGYEYQLANGTILVGARISRFEIDPSSHEVVSAGPAYDTVYDRTGNVVDEAADINELGEELLGFDRFCSAQGYQAGEYGFVDALFFANEETSAAFGSAHGGSVWVVDIESGDLWAAPDMGRGTWENVSAIQAPPGYVAIVMGDDFAPSPLYLYVGKKNPNGDFLERNGLSGGQMYVWVEKDGAADPRDFNGTGASTTGQFVPFEVQDPSQAGADGYDALGYKDDLTMREDAFAMGAFAMSRPEDVATNPKRGNQVVLASTGRGSLFDGVDEWGTTYVITVTNMRPGSRVRPYPPSINARIEILYDGDDAAANDLPDSDFGLRSPDNLEWAGDGYIYIQEDRATQTAEFAGVSGTDASIWKLDPRAPGYATRIALVNRDAILPGGQTDGDPDDLGDWETSGVLDVSGLIHTEGSTTLLGTVQAHAVRDGSVADLGLAEGGQLFLLYKVGAD